MTLSIPIPTLVVEGVQGNRLPGSKPIMLGCGAVRYADGARLTPANASRFGFIVYRRLVSGDVEAWNVSDERWQPDTPSREQEPEPLAYIEDAWWAIIVPVGQKDASDQARFATNRDSGFPVYYVRCTFAGADASGAAHTALGPPSREVSIYAAGSLDRAGLAMTPADAATAGAIGLFLKTPSLATQAGAISLHEASSGYEISVEVSGARIVLTRDGDITLTPAAGRRVRVLGDLDVDGGALRVNGTAVHVP